MCDRVFLVNKCRRVKMLRNVELAVCEKRMYVVFPDSSRKQFGATMFPTMQQAEYRRYQHLTRTAIDRYLVRMNPGAVDMARTQLNRLEACID